MFLAVWFLYAADRLLDTTRPALLYVLEPRHHFHHRHRTAFLAAMIAAAGALSLLLPHAHLPHAYFALAALLLLWFTVVHLPRVPASARLPKEAVTGVIFSAAIWLPELPRHWHSAILFAALCTLNCTCIHAWETPQPTHPLTRLLVRYLTPLLVLLAATALLGTATALATGMAAAGLLVLHLNRHRITPVTLRAVADAVLLTPVFFLR